MSNPMYAERQLDHTDSIKLDVFLRNNGFGNPFLDAHKTLVKTCLLVQKRSCLLQ